MLGITHSHVPAGAALHHERRRHMMRLAVVAAVIVAFTIAGALALAVGGADAPGTTAAPAAEQSITQPGLRYDGGPEEGTRGFGDLSAPNPGRPDGGPEEGTRGPGH